MIECKDNFILLGFLAILICCYGVIGYIENNDRAETIRLEKDAKKWQPFARSCQKIKDDGENVKRLCNKTTIEISKEIDKKSEDMK